MKKKVFAITLILSLLASSSSLSFATTHDSEKELQVKEKSAVIAAAEVVGTNEVIDDINDTSNGFVANLEDITVTIPKNGSEPVKTEISTGQTLLMELPQDVANEEGILTENGTVIYNSANEKFDILVQPTENDTISGVKECGVRTLIVIDNATAPHEYEFKYNLPDGSKLVSGKEFKSNEIDDNEVVILDNEGFISGIIKAPWAKDINGKIIDSYYTIKGNTLVQYVDFNQNTQFPVIADPWYGTSSKTENIGSTFKRGFTTYAAGQGTDGFYFDSKGGFITYSRGSGTSASVSIDVGGGFKAVVLSASIGFASKGSSVSTGYPVADGAGWYKLRVTEYYNIQKYKVLRRWKDPETQRVSWKEFSRSAKKVSYAGLYATTVKQS